MYMAFISLNYPPGGYPELELTLQKLKPDWNRHFDNWKRQFATRYTTIKDVSMRTSPYLACSDTCCRPKNEAKTAENGEGKLGPRELKTGRQDGCNQKIAKKLPGSPGTNQEYVLNGNKSWEYIMAIWKLEL